ncbi:MAG: hypothetical protein AAGA57_00015 [Planctomycetota bacterium]
MTIDPVMVILTFTLATPLLFLLMPAPRAVLLIFFLGWMFLPNISDAEAFNLPLLPKVRKTTAPGYAVAIGMVLFDLGRVLAFRFKAIDWLALTFVFIPVISCFMNFEYFGYSPLRAVHGSLSLVLPNVLTWGVPYFAGRLYFSDGPGMLRLVKAFVTAAMVYAPFCLIEARMTPQFHRWVYGYHATDFAMAMRLGGFRPRVFMWHGLMTGLFMCSAAVAATWLWVSGSVKKMWVFPMWMVAPGMIGMGIVTKSTGAIGLMLAFLAAMAVIYVTKLKWILVVMAMAAPLYITVRVLGWQGFELLNLAHKFDDERAMSLGGRMMNENAFIQRGLERPLFGWAGWDRWHGRIDGSLSAQAERYADRITVPDGWWVIAFGTTGFVGLGSLILYLTMPAILLVKRVPLKYWFGPAGAAAAIAFVCAMLMTDSIFNRMEAQPYHMMVGAAVGTLATFRVGAGAARPMRRRAGPQSSGPATDALPEAESAPDAPPEPPPDVPPDAPPHGPPIAPRGPALGSA